LVRATVTALGEGGDGDPGQDRQPAERLLERERVPERDDSRQRADERLEVEERPGELRRHTNLRPREQPERRQRAGQPERGHGGQRSRPRRRGRRPFGDRRHRQRGERGGAELNCGDRARVAAGEQPRLKHDEPGRARDRREHEQVARERRAGAPGAGDERDAGDGDERAGPRSGAGGPAPGRRRDHDDEHGHGADDQGRVAHARALDARVLEQDHGAVAERARGGDARGQRRAHMAAREQREQRRGEREAHDGEPARAEPLQAELRQRHREPPQRAGRRQREDRAAAARCGRVLRHEHIVGGIVRRSSEI